MGVAERLNEHVRRAGCERIQRGKHENASEAIGQPGIERNMLYRAAEPELVIAAYERCGVHEFNVIFGSGRIENRGLPNAHDSRDFEERALGVWREIDPATCELETDFVDEMRTADRLPTRG